MEGEDFKEVIKKPFDFLEEQIVQDHFADLNISLLQGRHIQNDQYYLFRLLTEFPDELRHYYKVLYGLELQDDISNGKRFYYLDFPDEGKGALSAASRSRDLTVIQTIIGLMFLNMFYDRYFEQPKEIRFENIEYEIMEGENSTLYKQLLFNEVRDSYSELEWRGPLKSIKNVIRDFEKLGWVHRLSNEEGEEIHFNLKEPVTRFQKLYENEIVNFDKFTESYLRQK